MKKLFTFLLRYSILIFGRVYQITIMDKKYTTGQVAKLVGVHKNTILYWLNTGKIKEPTRDTLFNGRIWGEKDISELKKLKRKERK